MIARANAAQIFLFNAHTNADHARPGVADALADVLGLVETEALVPTSLDSVTGTGRIGDLINPCSVSELVDRINEVLPGARARAHGEGMASKVALCPGSGDSFLADTRRSGADVYITSDLRHHPVQEHEQAGGCPLIDINHVVAESAWLPVLQRELLAELPVQVAISSVDTRAWRSN
jgi:putative NIF3 family GTP cyclohydrolase 1 type 2